MTSKVHSTRSHRLRAFAGPIACVVAVIAALLGNAADARAQDLSESPFDPSRPHFMFSLEPTLFMFNATADHRNFTTVNLDVQPGVGGTFGAIFPEAYFFAHGHLLGVNWHDGFVNIDFRSQVWLATEFIVHPKIFANIRLYDFDGVNLLGVGVGGGVGVDFGLSKFMLLGFDFSIMYIFFEQGSLDGVSFEIRLPITFVL